MFLLNWCSFSSINFFKMVIFSAVWLLPCARYSGRRHRLRQHDGRPCQTPTRIWKQARDRTGPSWSSCTSRVFVKTRRFGVVSIDWHQQQAGGDWGKGGAECGTAAARQKTQSGPWRDSFSTRRCRQQVKLICAHPYLLIHHHTHLFCESCKRAAAASSPYCRPHLLPEHTQQAFISCSLEPAHLVLAQKLLLESWWCHALP